MRWRWDSPITSLFSKLSSLVWLALRICILMNSIFVLLSWSICWAAASNFRSCGTREEDISTPSDQMIVEIFIHSKKKQTKTDRRNLLCCNYNPVINTCARTHSTQKLSRVLMLDADGATHRKDLRPAGISSLTSQLFPTRSSVCVSVLLTPPQVKRSFLVIFLQLPVTTERSKDS